MKQLNLYFLIFTVFNSSFIIAQNSFKETVIDPIQTDALYREKVFVHTNKTSYFNEDNIWFKAYAVTDATNSPSEYTTNLEVNLLNSKGDLVEGKTIFIQNGVGVGNFYLDSKLHSGTYYLQASTNFMKNFGAYNSYFQKIELINVTAKNESTQITDLSEVYDIQVFPESGYLLEDTENTLGIKALINGKGQAYSGKIIDSNGKVIHEFNSNELGFSKSDFFYNVDENYKAILKFKNSEKEIDLPKANKTGIIFSLDNSHETRVKLTLKTNNRTLTTLKKDSLALLVYRNNYISEALTIALNNNFKTSQDLFLEKSKMLYGVNVITLFKNNNPIAERRLFVQKPNDQAAISITKLTNTKDSISYKIKAFGSDYNSLLASLSAAIVSKDSKIYKEQQNIKTAFLLSPYIKGTIENPAFYFNASNIDRKAYLDLLLLSQGWTSYTLSDKIKNINPKEKYEFESGFTINGTVKNHPKDYDIGILSKQNRLAAYSKIDKASTFSFKNVYAYKNDSVKIALIKKSEALIKPDQVSFTINEPLKENYKHLINPQTNYTAKKAIQSKNDYDNSNYFGNEVEQLDAVILDNVKAKKTDSNYEKELNLAYKHNLLAPSFYQNKKVTEKTESTYQTLMAYLIHKGCSIKVDDSGNNFLVLREIPTTFYGQNGTQGFLPASIYINDVAIPRFDIQMLTDLQMYEVDEILINKLGAGEGLTGAGGVIKIYLKKGGHQYYDEPAKELYQNLLLLTGYDRADNYYQPLFNLTKTTLDWMEIDWKSSIKTDKNGEVVIKVPTNDFSDEYQIIINGISENGLLLHDIYMENSNEF